MSVHQIDSWEHTCNGILVESGWASKNLEGRYTLTTAYEFNPDLEPDKLNALLDLDWHWVDGKIEKEPRAPRFWKIHRTALNILVEWKPGIVTGHI